MALTTEQDRNRQAAKSRKWSISVSEIGSCPPVKNPHRVEQCRDNLLLFLQHYFPYTAGSGVFSADHIVFIDDLQDAIVFGGRIARAVFRGFAKTTIGELATIWALLYGWRRFVPLVGADAEASQYNLGSIKVELSSNDLLLEDFPKVCFPIKCLEGRTQRTHTQVCNGERTGISWTSDRVVLPTVAGSAASGACLLTTSIMAFNRGLKHKFLDGTDCRPDFVFIDDPQTDASAATDSQVKKREDKLNATILKSAGHKSTMSVFVAGTIIRRGCMMDRLTDPETSPSWRAKRVPMIKKWPVANEKWLTEYAAIRQSFDRDEPGDQDRARQRATDFYLANRDQMDFGAEVTWHACYTPELHEVSALQHAYNMLIDDGKETFDSECQNDPQYDTGDMGFVSVHDLCRKTTHNKRGEVPASCEWLVSAVDVQGSALYWTVLAFDMDFNGHVVDYGCWPPQNRSYYSLSDITRTLQKRYGTKEQGAIIRLGLSELFSSKFATDWTREDGSTQRLAIAAIDSAWAESTEQVTAFATGAKFGYPVFPSVGKSITAANIPLAEWSRHKGQRHGDCWVLAKPQGRLARRLLIDVNSWKTRLHRAILMPLGGQGSLSLFDARPDEHRMISEHLTSESPRRTEGGGRVVYQWFQRPGADNHLFDCATTCFALASVVGAMRPGASRAPKKHRRVRYAM